jgi:hypothetical protein
MNKRMKALLRGESDLTALLPTQELPLSLQEIADAGWVVKSNGALLLAALDEADHPGPSSFMNLTFYEASINHVHIPGSDAEGGQARSVRVAYSFCSHLMYAAPGLPANSVPLIAVIAVGGKADGTSTRVYTKRPGESWVDEDLDNYADEAVMTFGTSEGYSRFPSKVQTNNG